MPDSLTRRGQTIAAHATGRDAFELGGYRLTLANGADTFTRGGFNLFGRKPDRHRRTFRVVLARGTDAQGSVSCTVEYSWIRDITSEHTGERDKKVWFGCANASDRFTLSTGTEGDYTGTLTWKGRSLRLGSFAAPGGSAATTEPGGFVLYDGNTALAAVDKTHTAVLFAGPADPALITLLGSFLFFSTSPPERTREYVF